MACLRGLFGRDIHRPPADMPMAIRSGTVEIPTESPRPQTMIPSTAQSSDPPTSVIVPIVVTDRNGGATVVFGGNKQPIEVFRVAKGGNIALTVAGANPGILIGCVPGIVCKAMICNVQSAELTSRIKGGGILDVHTVNPTPDIAPEVFLATIGHDLNAVRVGNCAGIVAQFGSCLLYTSPSPRD